MTLLPHHEHLTNGVGKCSVPMWMGGLPAGFCDADAYGRSTSIWYGEHGTYVPALACPNHGGPKTPEEKRAEGT